MIVPGVRVGPITKKTTDAALKRYFGAANVLHEELRARDADPVPGFVVYRSPHYRATNRSLVIFPDEAGRAGTIWISAPQWRTASGIRNGATLAELEHLNGRPFRLYGFSWDFEGDVVSWDGGRLESELGHGVGVSLYPATSPSGNWRVKLSDQESRSISGSKELQSSHAVLRKLGLTVTLIRVNLQ